MSFRFTKHEYLKSNTKGATLILAIITKAKQELACNNNIIKGI
jgi:hypothetical protein